MIFFKIVFAMSWYTFKGDIVSTVPTAEVRSSWAWYDTFSKLFFRPHEGFCNMQYVICMVWLIFVCKKYAVFACCYCDEIIKSRAPRYEEMLPIYSGKCILRQNESI